ncbi:hypothetical protein NPIL_363851 [Nephila pilipes]|uniref:Uncharacterized protein n=1 Tax=Nephila pilipes TaxID=299642 RepID=A0A8X6QY20_NEPPI|nr:hypothetical protein NPIL_363851 [Nephila pilipes]
MASENIQSFLLEECEVYEDSQSFFGHQETHIEDEYYDIDDAEEIEEIDEDSHTEQSDTDSNSDEYDEKDCFMALRKESGINSQVLYMGNGNKAISRRKFLKCLGKELINDQLQRRAKTSCLPQSISIRLHEILPKTEQFDVKDMIMNSSDNLNVTRKRCRPCLLEKRQRKSRFSCCMCGSCLCLQHCAFVCQNGCKINESIKEDEEW